MKFKVEVSFVMDTSNIYTKRGVDKTLKESAANFADRAVGDIEYHTEFRKGIDDKAQGTIGTARHEDFQVIIREMK